MRASDRQSVKPGIVAKRTTELAVLMLLGLATGCGSQTSGSPGTAAYPSNTAPEASAESTTGSSAPAKGRLARNRPPQYLDPRIGK